jgi:putative membrane protein
VLPGGEELAGSGPGATVDGVATDGNGTMNSTVSERGNGDIVGPAVDVTPPRNAREYVSQTAAASQYEIQSSQLVLKESQNASVRAFAQQMIDDHGAATKKLQAAAQRANLPTPPTTLTAEQQEQMEELRAAASAGAASSTINQVYISQQRGAHAKAVALHQGVANGSAMPDPIQAHARETLVIVQGHARMLRNLNPAS